MARYLIIAFGAILLTVGLIVIATASKQIDVNPGYEEFAE